MLREWGGIFLVIGGLALVGLSDFFAPSNNANLTSTAAPASNHSTGQIILGMYSVFQTKCHGIAIGIPALYSGVTGHNFFAPTVLINIFHDFPLSFQANAGIVPLADLFTFILPFSAV
jgi:hypothetical protein